MTIFPTTHTVDRFGATSTGKIRTTSGALVRVFLLTLLAQFLVACGGGGGGSNRTPPPPETGSVQVTVVDEFNGPVSGVQITVTSGASNGAGSTSADGIATIAGVNVGTASISSSVVGFEDGTGSISVSANQESASTLTLVRLTEPAAGLFSAQLTQALSSTDGQTVTFSVDVLVVDDDSTTASALETLTAADFSLQPCTDSDPAVVECLRGGTGQADIGYSVVSATPDNFQLTPGGAANPYAATLMIDQSGSIDDSDPTDARLFATKVFLDNLGASDYVSVSAFAQDAGTTEPALIAEQPVTRLSDFVQSSAAQTVIDNLDPLGQQEGGDTPLFDALDRELDYTAANAPAGSNRRFAVVLFTDGEDTTCKPTTVPACGVDVSIQKSIDLNVDIFTIGLGANIDVDVLRRLSEGGRGFYLFAENAQQLFPIYRSLGELLSRTLSTYRMEWTIRADQAAAYMDGQTILGTLVIDTGRNQINLPVRLFLP